MPVCGRLFPEAKAMFLFGLRAELRIKFCWKGLTSLTTLAVSRAWRGVGVGSGVKGAVLWRSSRPLTPLFTLYAWSRGRSVMFFIELRSLTARFFGLGQSCMGLCSNCIVLTAHCVVVKIVEDSRPHPSVCGHRLRPGLPSRTLACARGRVLTQVSGLVVRPYQAPSSPATRLRWRRPRPSFRRRNIQ